MRQINLLALLARVVFKRVLYLDREAYLLEWNGRKGLLGIEPAASLPPGRKIYAVILGKTMYHESAKIFPIKSAQDVRKAIELQSGELCPCACGRIFARVVPDGENQSVANMWFIKEEAQERISGIKPYLALPETALLARSGPEEPTGAAPAEREEAGGGRLYVADKNGRLLLGFVNGKGISSSCEMKNCEQEPAIRSFRRMIGFEANSASETRFSYPRQFLQVLYDRLLQLGPGDLLRFQLHDPLRLLASQRRLLLRAGACTAAIILSYFLLYTGLLINAERQLEGEYKGKEAVLAQYARMEEEIGKQGKLYREIEERVRATSSKVALLNLLYEKLPERTTITTLKVSDREVELRATAVRAVDVLEALNGAPQIENARFTSGIQKIVSSHNKGLEAFVIGFRLK